MHATCDLHDRFRDEARIPDASYRPYGGRPAFSGRAVTVRCHEDNSRVKELSATPGAGRVLVVDGGASPRCALMGDMIAGEFVRNGWAGVVIRGAVRDVAALAMLDLGIMALCHVPRASTRRGVGESGIEIDIGGAICRQDDHVFADEDGIVILDGTIADITLVP